MTDLALETRSGLPDALRVLLEAFPKQGWTEHPKFDALIRFWLDRHLMFRHLMTEMQTSTEAVLDHKIDVQKFAGHVSRYGGLFVNGLHEHHMVEDSFYFPKLQVRDRRVTSGFDILDADHHALDGHLQAFVESANSALSRLDDRNLIQTNAAAFLGRLTEMQRLLDRHLVDEEELVVPVILKYGSSDLGH